MGLAEHTPGPWSIGNKRLLGYIPVWAPEAAYIVAAVHVTSDVNEEANALLIAAAPALKSIVLGFLATLEVAEGEDEAVMRSYYNQNMALFNTAVATIDHYHL
jgi:hypothetical protein